MKTNVAAFLVATVAAAGHHRLVWVTAAEDEKEYCPAEKTRRLMNDIEGNEAGSIRSRNLRGGQEVDEDNNRELFGGEDFAKGGPWYHECLSEEAVKEAGFNEKVAERIAWNADKTDSMTYNPAYWFGYGEGGLFDRGFEVTFNRFKAAKSTHKDLLKVHFDDMNTNLKVISANYRYLTGCLVGLHWAAQIAEGKHKGERNLDPLAAAHNIIGVTFHAIQDTYSHSNWIDAKSRRDKTLFDMTIKELQNANLYTAWSQMPGRRKPHGKPQALNAEARICLIKKNKAAKAAMDTYCAIPGISNDDQCKNYRDCTNFKAIHNANAQVMGVDLPDGVFYNQPAGINLDNSWLADVGVKVRGIDLSGAEAFKLAKKLAVKASIRLLEISENFMKANGHGAFWKKVKTTVSKDKFGPFEKFNQFPFQFLSAGPYPNIPNDDNGYYLRVVLKTSKDQNAGTDADIKLHAEGEEYLMDYMPEDSFLYAYNDFEKGSETVYTVGPFKRMPSQITIKNHAPSWKNTFSLSGIQQTWASLTKSDSSFFKNDADYIGSKSVTLENKALQSIPKGRYKNYNAYVNGGSEGQYVIHFTVYHLGSASTEDKYKVKITKIYCKKDSNEWGKDEVFILAALYSFGRESKDQFYMSPVKNNMKKGKSAYLNYNFNTVTFPKPLGAININFAAWESDSEGKKGRNKIFNNFKGLKDKNEKKDGFFNKLGQKVAADWKLDETSVYGFQRSKDGMKAGLVLHDKKARWIAGGKGHTFQLNKNELKTLKNPSNVDLA